MTWKLTFVRGRSALAAVPTALLLLLAVVATGTAGAAADTGGLATVEGRVVDDNGAAMPGLTVRLSGDAVPQRIEQQSAQDGGFRFAGLTPARYLVHLEINGLELAAPTEVGVLPDRTERVTLTVPRSFSAELTVTETREPELLRHVPAAVGVIGHDEIAANRATHPGQLLGQVPGVWINQTSGEGHMAAIRQPLTTNPVYLYLEDGVPTRSTGFFNHNALYEVNIPMAESVEVTRGPGSALYGSDAIGGVINVTTRSPFSSPGAQATLDAGSFGWRRALLSADLAGERQAVRLDANLSHSDGWRDATGYDRQSFTLRWDAIVGERTFVKTVVAYSGIDQQTAGSSVLSRADYEDDPTLNLTPISFREVEALRLSTEVAREGETYRLSVIPYVRVDSMDILPNWSLTYDPTVYTTENNSFGVLAKVSRSFEPWRTAVSAGFDVDLSPGGRVEDRIAPGATVLPGGQRVFTSYTVGARVYDYDVTYLGVAPYLHAEFSPTEKLRVTAGLRYDHSEYDYEDHLTTPDTPAHRRPASGGVSYSHLSPKLGLTYDLSPDLSVYAAYRNAFRAPSEGQVFRQGSARNTIGLAPVKADNLEAGVRWQPFRGWRLDASLYRLEKRDDILSYRNPADGATEAVNAGRTRHQGLELGLSGPLASWLTVALAGSHATHTYEEWAVDPLRGIDYSGNEMETAPRDIARLALTAAPAFARGGSLTVEGEHLGSYWMDAANTPSYEGHTLLHLRASMPIPGGLVAFARVSNVTDERYAETSSYTTFRGEELAPGLPRAFFVGVELDWGRR
ncbi:MAG: TonB-dependent receptor [Acidobacteria bacterium]|nr:TonB-dependent receptor [Acidobacteriota bacterium]